VDDQSILSRIEALVSEEHSLHTDESEPGAGEDSLLADRERLDAVSRELDQCWDLLRRRRALRAAGADPDAAEPRDEGTVEGYLQ
jgi:Protein of unknown function (DUF2630)